jgi:glycosyltransferase involved in cell wall biosynthesis
MIVLQANKFHFVKGGAERYYLDVSRRLRARGHTVIPFAMRHARNEPSEFERYFVSEVDYHGSMGTLHKLRAAARSVYSRETVRRIGDLVAHERPQVAHLHNIYHQISPALIQALDHQGVPMVQTLHDYKVICPGYLFMAGGQICECCRGGRYHNAIARRCLLDSRGASLVGAVEAYVHRWLRTYEKVRFFLCPSQFMLEKMAEYGVARERLVHLPYFLPLEEYRPGYERSSYFIYLGRLSREKGVATLLAALRLRAGALLTCRILGEGPLEEQLRRQAAEWGLGNVEFSGYLQGEALHAMIRGAAFTVVPSEWYENLPFAVLESFALGTPVVGARIGGIPEMVLDERTGLTFTMGDSRDLAATLERMESRPEQVIEMGRAARRLVEERYAPEPHLEQLEALYARAVAGG